MKNKLKKAIATIGTAATIAGGSAGVTQHNINTFRNDLEVQGIQQEQATHLAQYFKGSKLIKKYLGDTTIGKKLGKRDTISINEMQSISNLYGKILKEGKITEIQSEKDLVKKLNKEIHKEAKWKQK